MSRKIVYFLLLISFLMSMKIWFAWSHSTSFILNILVAGGLSACVVHDRSFLSFDKKNIITFLLIVVGYLYINHDHISTNTFLYIVIYFIISYLSDEDKIECIDFISTIFPFIIIPGLILYLLLFVIDLPSFGTLVMDSSLTNEDSNYGIATNYLFYVKSEYSNYAMRFNGPFLEPGHLGMMSAFLLFTKDIRKLDYSAILLIVIVIASQSLAGFMLLFVGIVLQLYYYKLLSLKYVFAGISLFLCIYLFALYYNDGSNFLYENIFARLEYDETKGFVGNNRITEATDFIFLSCISDTATLLNGLPGAEDLLESGYISGTGFKMWMILHGLIGTIAALLVYFYRGIFSNNRVISLLFLTFILLMFAQRNYPFWTSWYMCFLFGITKKEQEQGLEQDNYYYDEYL